MTLISSQFRVIMIRTFSIVSCVLSGIEARASYDACQMFIVALGGIPDGKQCMSRSDICPGFLKSIQNRSIGPIELALESEVEHLQAMDLFTEVTCPNATRWAREHTPVVYLTREEIVRHRERDHVVQNRDYFDRPTD